MLGLSRLGVLAGHEPPDPERARRLHPTRSHAVRRHRDRGASWPRRSSSPEDLDFLVGIYAFGALLAFMIAHLSIIALRFTRARPPAPVRDAAVDPRSAAASCRCPALLGALVSALRAGRARRPPRAARATSASRGWRSGSSLYVVYRDCAGQAGVQARHRPREALRGERPSARSTARSSSRSSARRSTTTSCRPPGAWRPTSTPTRPRARARRSRRSGSSRCRWRCRSTRALPDAAARAGARRAARARRRWGRSTRASRSRRRRSARAGPAQAIVEEARRRGVEAIVLAAEEPSRIRGGARLGGRGGRCENFVGEVTKYVVRKAPCRVILTAPPRRRTPADRAGGRREAERHAAAQPLRARVPPRCSS